jgi:hypothetical protein
MVFLGRIAVLLTALSALALADYEPNWPSVDSRPLPTWFDEAKGKTKEKREKKREMDKHTLHVFPFLLSLLLFALSLSAHSFPCDTQSASFYTGASTGQSVSQTAFASLGPPFLS